MPTLDAPRRAIDILSQTEHDVDRRRTAGPALAQLLVRRSAHLPPEEHALVQAVHEQGLTIATVAGLTGRDPRALRRHLRKVVTRLTHDTFAFVLTHRDQWPPTRRAVATQCFILGRSARQVARDLGVGYHVVRRHRDAILGAAALRPTHAAQSARSAAQAKAIGGDA